MNNPRKRNRITELACEAGLVAIDYNGFDRTSLTRKEKDFAKLVIQECSDIIQELILQGEPMTNFTNELQKLKECI